MALRKIQSDMVSNLADLDFNTATLYSNLSVFGEIRTTNLRWITGADVSVQSLTTLNDLNVSGNCTIAGNISALGTTTYLDTRVIVTSAMSITNTGTGPALLVNQTGANSIADFRDDGVSAFFIADGGNVGLGTNTPVSRLDVIGSANISGNTTVRGFLSAVEGFSTNDGLSSQTMFIQNNLGININNPQERLTILGNISASGNLSANNISTTQGLNILGGNFGIGVQNPQESLTVLGNISASGRIISKSLSDNIFITTLVFGG